jgi:hypothetical protein
VTGSNRRWFTARLDLCHYTPNFRRLALRALLLAGRLPWLARLILRLFLGMARDLSQTDGKFQSEECNRTRLVRQGTGNADTQR